MTKRLQSHAIDGHVSVGWAARSPQNRRPKVISIVAVAPRRLVSRLRSSAQLAAPSDATSESKFLQIHRTGAPLPNRIPALITPFLGATMRKAEVRKLPSMPAAGPSYPAGPYRFV